MTPRFTDETLNVLNVVKTMYQKSAGIQIVSKSKVQPTSLFSVCGDSKDMTFPGTYESCDPSKEHVLLGSEESWEECEKFVNRLTNETVGSDLKLLARYLAFDKEGEVVDLIERLGLRDALLSSVFLAIPEVDHDLYGPLPDEFTEDVLSSVIVWVTLNSDFDSKPMSEFCNQLWMRRKKARRRNEGVNITSSMVNWTKLLLTACVGLYDTNNLACCALKHLLANCGDDLQGEICEFVLESMNSSPSSRTLHLISQLAEVEVLRDKFEAMDVRPFLDLCGYEVAKSHEEMKVCFYACSILCQIVVRKEDIIAMNQLSMLKLSTIPIMLSTEDLTRHWPIISCLWEMLRIGKTEAQPMAMFNSYLLMAFFASRLNQEGESKCSREAGHTMVNMCLMQITNSLTNNEISTALESFLASVPSIDERRSFHKVFGIMVKDLQHLPHSQSFQRFWELWSEAHETNETSIGLTPGASLNLTLSPVNKGDAAVAAVDDDTLELDQTREEDAAVGQEYPPSTDTEEFLRRQNSELRKNFLTEQRRLKEAQEEQRGSVRALEAKDSLLKDALERLQMSLTKQEQIKNSERVATTWARECEEKLLLAHEEFEKATVDLIAKNDSMIATNSRLNAELADTRSRASALETSLETERSKAADLSAGLEEERSKRADNLKEIETQKADNLRLRKEVEDAETELRDGRDKIRAQEKRLKKAERESSKHKEILKYINAMTNAPVQAHARVDDDVEEDDENEKENAGMNERRLSLSIQKTLNRHLSQDAEEADL